MRVTFWPTAEPTREAGLSDEINGGGAVTARLEVAERLPSGFTTCSVHVLTVVPTFTGTAMEVALTEAGVSELLVPPE